MPHAKLSTRPPSAVQKADRAREECGALMTECDVGQMASRRPGALNNHARAPPTLPLRILGRATVSGHGNGLAAVITERG